MAVRAGLGAGLGAVVCGVDHHIMLDAAGGAVVMGREIVRVTIDALAYMDIRTLFRGRPLAGAGSAVVAGVATISGMGLACADEGRGGGGMAALAVGGHWGGGQVCLNGGRVVMGVAGEIGGVALGAGAAIAAIDRGVAVDPGAPAAVGRVVARGACGMDGADDIAGMAVDAKRGSHHRGGMVVGVAVKIGGMALRAGRANASDPATDIGRMGPATWRVIGVNQGRRRGMAIGAPRLMDEHRIGRRVADCHAGRIILNDV